MKTIQQVVLLISVLLLGVNAQAGRWLSPDPLEQMERDPHPTMPGSSFGNAVQVVPQANLYEFVNNNPVNFIDPLGLQSTYFDPGYGDISSYSSPQAWALWGRVNQIIGENMPTPGNGIAGAEEAPLLGMLENEFPKQFGQLGPPEVPPSPSVTPKPPCPVVNPSILRLPPTRPEGSDPFKLSSQMQQYAKSVQGMPPIEVTLGADGEMMINDGVTRATRAAMTGNDVPINVIENNPSLYLGNLPTVGSAVSGK